MNDVDQLIAVCQSLCNTLDMIAENERKFGHELCCKFGDMAYEAYKINCELASVKEAIRGYL